MKLVVRTVALCDMSFFTSVRPVEYESISKFRDDLIAAAESGGWEFEFAGHRWSRNEFGYEKNGSNGHDRHGSWEWFWDCVEVMTVAEWFLKYSKFVKK